MVTVRSFEAGDLDRCVKIVRTTMDAQDGRACRRELSGILEGWKGGSCWVAEEDGTVIGLVGIMRDDEVDDVVWLGYFAVDPAHHRRGLGKQLFEVAVAAARDGNNRRLYVDTSSTAPFTAARAFYKAMGLSLDATLPDFYGKGEDQLFFRMSLRD